MKLEEQLKEFSDKVHKTAVDHGWWENPRSTEECLELIHCELAEAVEGYREGSKPCPKLLGKSTDGVDFTTVEEEMADVMIRLLDMAGMMWSNWHLLGDTIKSLAESEGTTVSLDDDSPSVNFNALGESLIHIDSPDVLGRDLTFLEDIYYMREGMAAARANLDRAIVIITMFCAKLSAKYNLRTIPAMIAKAEYNESRPYRHGGKLA